MGRIWTGGQRANQYSKKSLRCEATREQTFKAKKGNFYETETLAFMPVLTTGRWNTSRSFKLVQSLFAFTLLEQSLCVSLVANKLSLCFCVWVYRFYCWADESTGKPCNDRGKHWLGERKNTLKRWGSQAASGHNASFSVAEELAMETAGNGYNSPVIKTSNTTTQHTNQWFNNCVNETDYLVGPGGFKSPPAVICSLWAWSGLPQQTYTFPSGTFILRLFLLHLLYQNILKHHILLRLVFIDIYGSVRKFQWESGAFPHSVYLGLENLSLVAALFPWGS